MHPTVQRSDVDKEHASAQTASSSATPSPGIWFSAYRRAEQYLNRAVFDLRRKADPVLGNIQFVESEHEGPIRSVGGENPFDARQREHVIQSSIPIKAIEALDFSAYVAYLNNNAEQALQALGSTFVQGVKALTAHVGNSVDSAGKSLFESLKEGLLKLDFDFDEDGKLNLPTLHIPPGTEAEFKLAFGSVMADPDVQRHIEAKRSAFLSDRPTRRLMSPC